MAEATKIYMEVLFSPVFAGCCSKGEEEREREKEARPAATLSKAQQGQSLHCHKIAFFLWNWGLPQFHKGPNLKRC